MNTIDARGNVFVASGFSILSEKEEVVRSSVFTSLEQLKNIECISSLSGEKLSKIKNQEQFLLMRRCVRTFFAGKKKKSPAPAALVPRPQLFPLATPLAALLYEGKWGEAFMSGAANLGLPPAGAPGAPAISISRATIDKIFAWEADLSVACRRGYAEMIEDLLALPTGRGLIKNIILMHHNHVGLSRMVFKCDTTNTASRGDWMSYPNPYEINIKWNGANYEGEEYILVVNNINVGSLDFVKVRVSPAIVLAHELGHFLDGLTEQKKFISTDNPGVAGGALGDAQAHNDIDVSDSTLNAVLYDISDRADKRMDVYMCAEYKKIFQEVITTPPTEVDMFFMECWNAGEYSEAVNILPSVEILNPGGGSFNYSDGIIIGEALNPVNGILADRRPQFFNLTTGNQQNVNIANAAVILPPDSFVRFGHMDVGDFRKKFERLKDEQKSQFRALVQKVLDKITINGNSLSPANRNLPWI
jgi:hypothetical protein